MGLALALALGLEVVASQEAAPAQPPLSMAAAVAQARMGSPLRGAAQGLADGTARAAQLAGRLLNPVLDVRGENFGPTSPRLPLDVFAVVSQAVELGGKRAARLGVAFADRDVAGANLAVVDRQISLRTVQLYIEALRARGIVESLQVNRDGLATLIASVHRRVDEGYSAESDLLRFETEAARVDIELARAGVALERSLATLAVVIGATGPIAASQLLVPSSMPPPAADASAIAAAVARHPDVLSADARVVRARQGRAFEETRRLPDPLVTAGFKRTAGFDTAVAGVTMSVPLFDRNKAAVARAAGEEVAAAAERGAVQRRLVAEATALIAAARALSARSARSDQDLLTPADAVRSAARATFREGTADVLKLIDAERVHADVRRAALELRLEALAATIEARFALGEDTLP
jgi:cobalt-zinc-cadmium efflux system outer membrane protein